MIFNRLIKLTIFSTPVYYYFIKIENPKSGVVCVCLFVLLLLLCLVLLCFVKFFSCLFLFFSLQRDSMSG